MNKAIRNINNKYGLWFNELNLNSGAKIQKWKNLNYLILEFSFYDWVIVNNWKKIFFFLQKRIFEGSEEEILNEKKESDIGKGKKTSGW